MDFEKLYSKLPDFIKYNRVVLDFFLKIPKKLDKFNKKSRVNESHQQLFELMLVHSDFKAKGTLRNIQLLYVELLRFIDNVCNKYSLNYWISDGTLIGAVRHGGFIPWDDDIDVSILREDYEKLIEILPKEIEKYDYFKQECGLSLLRDNHENYFKDFKSVYDVKGDVNLIDENKFMFLQIAWMEPFIKIDFFPKCYLKEEKLDYFKKHFVSTKYKFNQEIKNGIKNFDSEFKVRSKELGFTCNKTDYFNDCMDALQLDPVWIYETSEVFPLEKINFEGYEFNCPKNIDFYLTVMFGPNYMHLPDVIETHNLIPFIESQFNSKEEMDEKFKKDIEYLREINDNFNKK